MAEVLASRDAPDRDVVKGLRGDIRRELDHEGRIQQDLAKNVGPDRAAAPDIVSLVEPDAHLDPTALVAEVGETDPSGVKLLCPARHPVRQALELAAAKNVSGWIRPIDARERIAVSHGLPDRE